jgi:hypothetical protein
MSLTATRIRAVQLATECTAFHFNGLHEYRANRKQIWKRAVSQDCAL